MVHGNEFLIWHYSDVIMNERNGVSNHSHFDYLPNRLSKCRSNKKTKLCTTGLCEGNSPVTGDFLAQRASNSENVSIWWRHHVIWEKYHQSARRQVYNRQLGLMTLNHERRTSCEQWPLFFTRWQLCAGLLYLGTRISLLHTAVPTQMSRFMRPTWGPPGADRTQVGPMLAPWTLLPG